VTYLAIISDIHSNALALEQALTQIAARDVDGLVLLGDLFTYGAQPARVLDLISDCKLDLICGNHDLLYTTRDSEYERSLPKWIRESVEANRSAISGRAVPIGAKELERGGFFFAHANPFTFGDWTYLNDPPVIARAAETLRRSGWHGGVFGHTHRRRISIVSGNGVVRDVPPTSVTLPLNETLVINAGSIGQPRGTGATILYMQIDSDSVSVEFDEVRYDVQRHLETIRLSDVSQSTKSRLLGFFV
jgi:predicted phosphodiesterase